MFSSLRKANEPKPKGTVPAIAKSAILATLLTGMCAALLSWSTVLQALFLFTIAPTLLAALNSVSAIPLGVINNGFFVPNQFGLWLTAGLIWSVVFVLAFVDAKHQ